MPNSTRDQVYAEWKRGNRLLRLALTVLDERPGLDLRVGDMNGPFWVPSKRGVFISLDEIDLLMASLRRASADIKKFGLVNKDRDSMRIRPQPKRWRRD